MRGGRWGNQVDADPNPARVWDVLLLKNPAAAARRGLNEET
jgi:hypothetical protein